MTFSAGEKRAEAEREVAMRKSVYRRTLLPGERISAQLQRRIAIMEEIAADYRRIERETEELPL